MAVPSSCDASCCPTCCSCSTAQGLWHAYRDVAVVDGSPVRNRTDRVLALFQSTTKDREAQLRRINDESARYNLGDVRRTLNTPTVAIGFLRSSDIARFKFKREKDETVDGVPSRVLRFTENVRPTLIQTPRGTDLPVEGRVWLDPVRRQILRTELRLEAGGERQMLLRVDFRMEPALNAWVPASMWEWYELSRPMASVESSGGVFNTAGMNALGGGEYKLVQCLATYSTFRRFLVQTSEELK